jgi:hypothetical protein
VENVRSIRKLRGKKSLATLFSILSASVAVLEYLYMLVLDTHRLSVKTLRASVNQ